MKVPPLLPSSDIKLTKSFYGRLGFDVQDEQDGAQALLVMAKADIVLKFYFDEKLQPLKNHIMAHVETEDVDGMVIELQALFRPAESGLEGWLVPVKDDEVHLVDPDGNLLMIRGPR